jgi:hypothetical protein
MFLVASAAALASSNPASASAWSTYANVRFGYQICYPALVLRSQREADNGDGRRFVGANGAELLVFGQYTLGSSLAAWASDEASVYTGKRGRITYRAGRANWLVLSGDDGGRFQFYTKTLKRDERFVTFQLKYPASQARLFRPIVERLSRCLVLNKPPF